MTMPACVLLYCYSWMTLPACVLLYCYSWMTLPVCVLFCVALCSWWDDICQLCKHKQLFKNVMLLIEILSLYGVWLSCWPIIYPTGFVCNLIWISRTWIENKNTNKLHLYMIKHFPNLAMQWICIPTITSLVDGLVVAVHNICYPAHLTPAPYIFIWWVTWKMVYWGWHWSPWTLILNSATETLNSCSLFFLTFRQWQIHKYWESDPCIYEIPKW